MDTTLIDGAIRPVTNDRGRSLGHDPAALTAFWRYFGTSQAVNAAGQPLQLYHGTPADFSAFEANANGIFFSQDPGYASDYAGEDEGATVMAVHLLMENPYRISGDDLDAGKGLLAHEAKEAGYDGYIVDYGGSADFAVFDPRQIKSALSNRGTFDPDDSNITDGLQIGCASAAAPGIEDDTRLQRRLRP